VVVPLSLALAPGGGEQGYAFGRLWTLFGTTNQLTAGLALSVIAVYVTRRGRNAMAQIVPLAFLLVMTVWALFLNLRNFLEDRDWVLLPLDIIILVLAVWLVAEAFLALRKARASRPSARTWTPRRDERAPRTGCCWSVSGTSRPPVRGAADGSRAARASSPPRPTSRAAGPTWRRSGRSTAR
jgi:carbon starvation protein